MPDPPPSLSPPPPAADRARVLLALALAGAALALVAAVAVTSALRTVGRPTAHLLLDPFGAYSNVSLLGWSQPATALAFPDRIVAVDGESVGSRVGYRDLPAARAREMLARRLAEGRTVATLRFRRSGAEVTQRAPLGRISRASVIPLVAVYLAMALCMAAAGVVVFVLARRSPGGRAYVFLSAVGFVFLATFIDYHTEAWLAPLFLLAYGGNVFGISWLAWSFPRPPRAPRAVRAAVRAGGALVLGVTLWAAFAPFLGVDPVGARVFLSLGIALSLVALAVGTVARWHTAAGRDREMIRSALTGLAVVPALIGVGMLMTLIASPRVMQAFIPLGGFFIPLSVGYALIRHNVFDTREVLTRRLLLAPTLMLAANAGAIGWLAVREVPSIESAAVFALFAAFAYGGLRRAADRYVFHAARIFQPTIEGLSDRFARLRDPLEVLGAIEGIARQCISVGDAAVVPPERIDGAALGALRRGERVWVGDGHADARLFVPMRSLGELRAVLLVRPRASGALLSSEDIALLETVASLGAVALHHANVIDELQSLRRIERAAIQQDKQSTVGTIAAELAHEIAVPLGFLRSVLRAGRDGRGLDDASLDDAQEQVDRLERLSLAFRRMQPAPPRRVPTELREVVRRALTLLRPALDEMQVRCEVNAAEDLVLAADPDALLQVISNLLRNAAQAAGNGGAVGVRTARTGEGARIDVWDDGPGIDPAIEAELFRPFVSTREAGTGLGLVVCARVIRVFAWQLDHLREDGRTVFRVEVPRADVLDAVVEAAR